METQEEKVLEYYQQATKDYEFWSKDFNMHFGLAKWNIFDREGMLKKMNREVLNSVVKNTQGKYIDAGCGCGATLRQGCKKYIKAVFNGITLSSWQVKKCEELMVKHKITNGQVFQGDYHDMPFEDDTYDGGYALESICHSPDRKKVIRQFSRKLKKGSRLVVADGFVKINPKDQGKIFKYAYKMLCDGWALPDLPNIHEFKKTIEKLGFKIISVKDLSWRIAPSVLHSPFIILKYLLYATFGKAPLKKQNVNNLKGSFIALFMGLYRAKFSYYMITAEKE